MRNLLPYFSFLLFLGFGSCKDNQNQVETIQTEASETANEQQLNTNSGTKRILFFGNSLTAGMGLEEQEAFPALIQQKLDSLNLDYEVINAGLSGETTAAGKNRVDWVMKQDVDIFVLELGANDGLRGVPLEETRRNLQAIIDQVREKNPDTEIILAGMQIPPNLGKDYAEGFKNIFPELAEKNNIELIPFLLEGVAGNPDLNQSDRIHPTAEGQKILAENVWETLEPMVREEQEQ